MRQAHLPLAYLLFFTLVLAACGHSATGGAGDASASSDGSPSGSYDSGSPVIVTGNDASPGSGALAISPLAPVLTVIPGTSVPTQKFTATASGSPVTGVTWSIDVGALGSIGGTGLFTPSATVGGVANVKATWNGETAKTTVTVNLQPTDIGDPGWTATAQDAGAGGFGGVGGNGPGAPPDGGQVATLNGTPTADPTVKLLYPYDGTVWPQGLLAPLLQWDPGTHVFDSVYVHITETGFDYKGYFAANKTPFVNVPIPEAAWTSMSMSNSGGPVTISLVFGEGGKAWGPYTETWKVAQALLQGTIYYNSYGTALVQNSDTVDSYGKQYGAATLGILPGATGPTLIAGVTSLGASGNGTGCRVCHTVAASGQTLVTQASNANAGDYSNTVTIDLAHDTTGGAGTSLGTPNLTFPALYKDGTLLFSGSGGMIDSDSASRLYDMPAGTLSSAATGLPSNFQAALPSFSPDGTLLSFNFWGGTLTSADGGAPLNGDQASLAVLDFDGKGAFTNPRILYTPPAGTPVIYSSFFPNSAGVVFEIELSAPSGSWGYTWQKNTSELWWADVATGKAHRLDSLNGYTSTGAIYLPAQSGASPAHTPAQDVTLNYEPTVNPIASGGYAWVVFTSRRMYGNVAQLDPWQSDPRRYAWQDSVTDKKLWVAAVDLNAAPGTDPSHPAFYLPGQELHAGNARGYWTVEPCRSNGRSCTAGDQCCGGYCEPSGDAGLACTASAPTCSGAFDKCTTAADCCAGSAFQCVNGVCTLPTPP